MPSATPPAWMVAPAIDPAVLSTMLDTRRPEILTSVGTVGLVVLVSLMVIKPG